MSALDEMLAEREDPARRKADAAQRAKAAEAWMLAGGDPADRLLKFDAWSRAKLEAMLDWSWAGVRRVKLVEQCRFELERLVCALWSRGWLLDGRRLAQIIEAALADMAKAQAEGRVREFWPFFVVVMRRHVGVNAEEIRAEAMAAGAHVGQAMQAILRASAGHGGAATTGPSITELVAQRRAELAARKWSERAEQAAKDELPLLGGLDTVKASSSHP